MAAKERSKRTIRLIGVFKLVKATLLVLLAFGVLRSLHGDVADTVHELAKALRVDPHAHIVEGLVSKLSGVSPERLRLLGFGTLAYAVLFATEGVGLLLAKVWAEWLAVVSTAGFIPLEVISLVHHVSWTHVATLAVNVLVVVYLLVERLRDRREKRPTGEGRHEQREQQEQQEHHEVHTSASGPTSWTASSAPRASQV